MTRGAFLLLFGLLADAVAFSVYSFQQSRSSGTPLCMFFADEKPSEKDSIEMPPSTSDSKSRVPVDLVTSENENFLNMAGAFLVDAFWLNSEHHQLGDASIISEEARMDLVVEQCADLQERYGEVMGKRLLNTYVLAGLNPETKEIVGLATLKCTLIIGDTILESEKAETLAKNAVASLGPKQRRQYKDASLETIATELMPPGTKAVCVLSNLAVSTKARRQGIAKILCDEVETEASCNWGYTEMHLVVEKDNVAASNLYQKLGYTVISESPSEVALRADIDEGCFNQVSVPTVTMSKRI